MNEPQQRAASAAAMFINGEWVEAISGERFEVTNPATGEGIGEVPNGGSADAERAIAAADAAFGAWAATTAHERADQEDLSHAICDSRDHDPT